jgi:hypothetical protein
MDRIWRFWNGFGFVIQEIYKIYWFLDFFDPSPLNSFITDIFTHPHRSKNHLKNPLQKSIHQPLLNKNQLPNAWVAQYFQFYILCFMCHISKKGSFSSFQIEINFQFNSVSSTANFQTYIFLIYANYN